MAAPPAPCRGARRGDGTTTGAGAGGVREPVSARRQDAALARIRRTPRQPAGRSSCPLTAARRAQAEPWPRLSGPERPGGPSGVADRLSAAHCLRFHGPGVRVFQPHGRTALGGAQVPVIVRRFVVHTLVTHAADRCRGRRRSRNRLWPASWPGILVTAMIAFRSSSTRPDCCATRDARRGALSGRRRRSVGFP